MRRGTHRPLTGRAYSFVSHFLRNGGYGTEAARAAGYSYSGAAVTASRLLADETVLRVLAREIVRRGAAVAETRRQLLSLSRPARLRGAFVDHLRKAGAPAAWLEDEGV